MRPGSPCRYDRAAEATARQSRSVGGRTTVVAGERSKKGSDSRSMTDDIWQRLKTAGLINDSDGERLRLAASRSGHLDTASVLAWLMKQSVVTQYQALLLANGYLGTFAYGDYRLVKRIDSPQRIGQFEALHIPSGHPVLLDFLPAGGEWTPARLEQLTRELPLHLAHRQVGLSDCHEWVVLPEYKFLVSERPPGQPVVPASSPPAFAAALRHIGQLADVVQSLHEQGLVHGAIRPENLTVVEQSLVLARHPLRGMQPLRPATATGRAIAVAQFPYAAPELLEPNQPPTSAGDLYALGCTCLQLITGEVPFFGQTFQALREQQATAMPAGWTEVTARCPAPVVELLQRWTAKSPADRGVSRDEMVALLGDHARPPARRPRLATSYVFERYLASCRGDLVSWSPSASPTRDVITAPNLSLLNVDYADRLAAQSRWETLCRRILLPLAGVSLAAVLILTWRWLVQPLDSAIATGTTSGKPTARESVEPAEPSETGPALPVDERFQVVPDDGRLLWARPTTGRACEFTYAPQGCQLFLVWRPNDVQAGPAWQVLAGLGPDLLAAVEAWRLRLALRWEEIERAAVYVAVGTDGRPAVVSQIMLTTDYDHLKTWPAAEANEVQRAGLWHRGEEVVYLPVAGERRQLVIGPEALVAEIAERNGQPPVLRREFEALRTMSDRDCQFNLLWAPNFLLHDGRDLLLPSYRKLPAVVDRFFGEGVGAMLLTVHVTATESFGELRLETTAACRKVLLRELPGKVMSLASRGDSFLSALPNIDEYWQPIAGRTRAMLGYLADHTRTGVEGRQLVLATSLPATAAQNLVMASELALVAAAAPRTGVTPPVSGTAIRTIEDMLALRTSLAFPQQTLEFALRDLAADVNATLVAPPFPFRIEISGSDLQQEGITRNQQIRDFRRQDQSVAELLTALLMKANPITTVRRANEADQRLVWTVKSAQPDQGGPFVLITTRRAVQDQGLVLPGVFQEE